MPFRVPAALLCLALAACSGGSDAADEATPAATASASTGPDGSATASAAAGGAKSVKEENDLYSFAYAYPAAAGAIPALARRLDTDLSRSKDELVAEAREARQEAEDAGFPYNPHYFSEEWQVIADLPGWLSLSGDFSTYTGGAHGNYGLESLVWDKAAGRGLPAIELFESPEALDGALGDKLCEALNRERAERREEPVAEGSDDPFDACVALDQATVLVGSSNKRTFNRIGVWFGPYVAGPYVEGAYELDFPVDAAILDTVRPAYREAFSVRR